ncbi:hypothetical protein BDC45DRAFT_513657, partial [Circinella umbellata]
FMGSVFFFRSTMYDPISFFFPIYMVLSCFVNCIKYINYSFTLGMIILFFQLLL